LLATIRKSEVFLVLYRRRCDRVPYRVRITSEAYGSAWGIDESRKLDYTYRPGTKDSSNYRSIYSKMEWFCPAIKDTCSAQDRMEVVPEPSRRGNGRRPRDVPMPGTALGLRPLQVCVL
jgi:hypothetical protein